MDPATVDEDGVPWDSAFPGRRRAALNTLKHDKPYFLIVSPMCKAFSMLQSLNRQRMGEHKWNTMISLAREHLRFAMQLCQLQLDERR